MKKEAPIRSDSCEASSAALEVRKAWPRSWLEASRRNGGRWTPPLLRVKAPEAQESRIATRTWAGMASRACRSSA